MTAGDPSIPAELVGYRIEALIGRGGMGIVYRAEDLALERKVALKLLAPELAGDERFRERFQRESRLAASIDHPAIVPVYEAGEVQGRLYIAMRYVEGTDLKSLLRNEGAMAPERALAICSQVADALDEAHQHGLVHGDVKPSNVLVDSRERGYLADFGLTRRSDDHGDRAGSLGLVGSSDYIAPEVIEGGSIDASADLYSLGCLLYECLTGEVPYPRDSELAVLWAHVHDPPPRPAGLPGLDAVFARALAKDPAQRHPSGRDLVRAAREAMQTAESRRRRRRPQAVAARMLAALAVALGLGLGLTLTGSEPRRNTTPTLTPPGHAIQRVDPATNTIVATLRLPVAKNKLATGGGWLWAANVDQNAVLKIDPREGVVRERVTGINPAALSFGGGSLWVLNARDAVVTQIAGDTVEVAGIVVLPAGSWDEGLPITATGEGVWISWVMPRGNAVYVDARNLSATPVQIGESVFSVVLGFAPAGPALVWVQATHPPDSTRVLHLVDPRREDLATTEPIPVGDSHYGRLASGGGYAWVADYDDDRVLRVDQGSQRVDKQVKVGDGPAAVAVGAGAVWSVNEGDGTVSRIDPERGTVVATIPVGRNPGAIAIDDDGVWIDVHPS